MDLRVFYQKIKSLEQTITAPHVVVVSVETPDGGKAGLRTEVKREQAAKLIVEGKARLATTEESEEYRELLTSAFKAKEAEQSATRLKVNVISDSELEALRSSSRKPK